MKYSPSSEGNRSSANQEIPALYGTRWFITTFKSALHLFLTCARSIQSMSPSHFLEIHY